MVPAYNAATTIEHTLRSVLEQDPGEATMQIAVLDNASTDGTLEAVARLNGEVGGERIEVHTNSTNLGVVGNWNACIYAARGELIHLLHADDFVKSGFYAAVEAAFSQQPAAELCVVRALVVDGQLEPERLARRLCRSAEGLSVYSLAYGNEFYAPGVVVKRSCYERVGGFSPALCCVPDWEMWLRILASGEGVYVNEALACYREAAGNLTSRYSQAAEDLAELVRFGMILSRRVPGFDRMKWRAYLANHAAWAADNWQRAGNPTAALINKALWHRLASPGARLDERLMILRDSSREFSRRIRRLVKPWKA
jgi:glycosyltransferase involved in cell wall biosynthesis